MSGLGQILLESGYKVTGSDISDSNLISKLRKTALKFPYLIISKMLNLLSLLFIQQQ